MCFNLSINVRESQMDNPEILATSGTKDEDKQNTRTEHR